MNESRTKFAVAFGLVYIIWGSTYLAIHYAIATIPPFLMAGTRFVTSGALLLAWAFARGAKPPPHSAWRNTGVVGLLLLLGGNGGVVWAEQSVPSGIAALLVAIVPVWMVVLEWVRPRGTLPSTRVGVGIVMGMIGMIVLVGFGAFHGAGRVNMLGASALILASLCWAAGSLYARAVELPSQLLATGMEMLVGGFGLIAFGTILGEWRRLDLHSVSTTSIAGVVYLIFFGSLIGYTAYSWLLEHAPSSMVGTYAYVNPVVAVFLGWLIADEAVSGRELLGAAIILASVVVITIASVSATPAISTLPAPAAAAPSGQRSPVVVE